MFTDVSINALHSALDGLAQRQQALCNDLANVNTVRPTNEAAFQARYVVAQSIEDGGTGQGVKVGGVELGSATGILTYDPQNPLADAQGYVRRPDIDMGDQMTQMIM